MEDKSNKPSGNGYWQQRLWSWDPVLTPSVIVLLLATLGVIALPVGIAVLYESNSLFESTVQYGGSGTSDVDCTSGICQATFNIDKDIDDTLYLYYELTNFYQNNIKYQKSIPWTQLTGEYVPEADLETTCSPLVLNNSLLLNPCGLVAQSFFTDTYALNTAGSQINGATPSSTALDETDLIFTEESLFVQPDGFDYKQVDACSDDCTIATTCKCYEPNDGKKYHYYYPNDDTTAYLYEMYPKHISPLDGVTDEHFKVWMSISALPTFRKLYGKLEGPFKSGDKVVVDVKSLYDVKSFHSTKSLVLTETYSLGLKNAGLGVTYIVCGAISLLMAVVFLLKQQISPRPLGSPAELKWR